MQFGAGGIAAGIHVALEVGRCHTHEKLVLSLRFISKLVPNVFGIPKDPGEGRGWSKTNFVELWLVSRPSFSEMAIEIHRVSVTHREWPNALCL